MSEKRAVLVYQAGIANVFAVDCFNLSDYGRNARRLFQGDFRGAEMFATALVETGVLVISLHCNKAGDITNEKWSDNLEEMPFYEQAKPVKQVNYGVQQKKLAQWNSRN